MSRPAGWPLVGAATMRALDRHTIETLGVPGDLLMESAGRAVADAALAALAELGRPGEVLALCGTGNNGGDGFVAARHLHCAGVPVRVALLGDPAAVRGDAARNLERLRRLELPLEPERWRLPAVGVAIDAIFGTGLARDVEGPARAAIRRLNAAREAHPADLRVIAVDLPSGLCADTGQVLGAAVRADLTVTVELPKLGLALEPGRSLAGCVRVARVGIAAAAPDVAADAELWSAAGAGALLPARPAAGHKGSFGHVLLVAGSEGKTGAAALAARAAGRSGAGLVTIACPAGLNDVLEIKCTEAMTAPLPDTPGRALAASAEETVLALAAERDAVGLGPGLGRAGETLALVTSLAKRLETPLALDADGLFAFADEPALLAARSAPTVLTPHPGEAARLLGARPADVNRDRVGAARRLAQASGATVVLKGAATVIASPEGRVAVNPTGGPALGSGGTGDVLLGMVAALLAQELPPFEAGALAAFWHGAAGDRLAAAQGASGLLAEDLADALPASAEALRAAARRPPRAPGPESHLAALFPGP